LWCPHGSLARPVLWDILIAVLVKLRTAPSIQQKLLYGISRWQHEGKDSAWPNNIPPYEDTVGQHTLQLILLSLSKNNWDGSRPYVAGRISKQWGVAQGRYYSERFDTSHHTGDAWAIRVISALLWDYSKAIWLAQNEASLPWGWLTSRRQG
jgi:hypothetical protein